jgi:ABC-type protease/lipase transport system fused ATPase/permease subunit
LQRAIVAAKKRGAIVIIIAHRPSSLIGCDKALVLMNGTQQAYGPRDQVLAKRLGRTPQPAAADRKLRVVTDTKGRSES